VTLIEQLSPDEALILKIVAEGKIYCEVQTDTIYEIGAIPMEYMIKNNFPLDQLSFESNFDMYLKHLNLLSLIDMPQYNISAPDESKEGKPIVIFRFIRLSSFGELFYKACMQ
jgi:hypothetical protein